MNEATQQRLFQGRWPHCVHCERAALACVGVRCSDRLIDHDIPCWCQSDREWVSA